MVVAATMKGLILTCITTNILHKLLIYDCTRNQTELLDSILKIFSCVQIYQYSMSYDFCQEIRDTIFYTHV